jgi:hypothetical protein
LPIGAPPGAAAASLAARIGAVYGQHSRALGRGHCAAGTVIGAAHRQAQGATGKDRCVRPQADGAR